MSRPGFQTTVDTTGAFIFQSSDGGGGLDGPSVRRFRVENDVGSTNNLLVQVRNQQEEGSIHDTDEFATIIPGDFRDYIARDNPIKSVFAKGSGGDADVNWDVTAV